MHGAPFLTESLAPRHVTTEEAHKQQQHEFKFYPENIYPKVFEAYANVNATIADMVRKSYSSSSLKPVVFELDGANGVLASLLRHDCHRFHSVMAFEKSCVNARQNLLEYCNGDGDSDDLYCRFVRGVARPNKHLYLCTNEVKASDEPTRPVVFIFQKFNYGLSKFERLASKSSSN